MSEKIDWMPEAREMAAQCWATETTSGIETDQILVAEKVARKIANWIETAAQNQRNTDYYRGLVVLCGEAIGQDAYVQDDGGISADVLCAKVPELVEDLVKAKPANQQTGE